MKAFTLLLTLVLAASATYAGNDRKDNKAPAILKFPASIKPKMHDQLLGLLPNESPFNDKRVDKVSVTKDWGPWYRWHGVEQQDLLTAVGVYDSKNSKCWVWHDVSFFRQRRDARALFGSVTQFVNEIDCNLLK